MWGGFGSERRRKIQADLYSKREEEVAYLVAAGLGNREIAARLNLNEHTIKNHLFRIFDKLGIALAGARESSKH